MTGRVTGISAVNDALQKMLHAYVNIFCNVDHWTLQSMPANAYKK